MTVDVSAAAATIREALEIARSAPFGVPDAYLDLLRRLDRLAPEALSALDQLVARLAATERERDAQKIATDTLARRRDDLERALVVQENEWKQRAERAEQQLAEAREAMSAAAGMAQHLAAITPHVQRCDKPDDPMCPACVAASEAARLADEAERVGELGASRVWFELNALGRELSRCFYRAEQIERMVQRVPR